MVQVSYLLARLRIMLLGGVLLAKALGWAETIVAYSSCHRSEKKRYAQ